MQFTTKLIPLAIALAFAGNAAAQEVVKIGHVGPISGASAHLGKDNENGAKLAVEELNAKGFLINGKKVKFELVLEDDGADPKQGTAVAQKLVAPRFPPRKFTTTPASRKSRRRRPTRSTPSKASRARFAWSPMTTSWAARWANML